MKILGITGGIGSGKSTICKVFEVLGYPVFNSDDQSKRILFSEEIRGVIKDVFGDAVFDKEALSRVKLAQVVFNNPQQLKKLNGILHPKVRNAFRAWRAKQSNSIVIKEAAILFESGANKSCDWVLNIQCAEAIRVKRVVQRDGRTEEAVRNIITKQLTEAERAKLADFTIVNEDQKVLPQLFSVLEKISEPV